jgi:hypothetical protein
MYPLLQRPALGDRQPGVMRHRVRVRVLQVGQRRWVEGVVGSLDERVVDRLAEGLVGVAGNGKQVQQEVIRGLERPECQEASGHVLDAEPSMFSTGHRRPRTPAKRAYLTGEVSRKTGEVKCLILGPQDERIADRGERSHGLGQVGNCSAKRPKMLELVVRQQWQLGANALFAGAAIEIACAMLPTHTQMFTRQRLPGNRQQLLRSSVRGPLVEQGQSIGRPQWIEPEVRTIPTPLVIDEGIGR